MIIVYPMHTFTGQVGAIVDDVIDQRFYEDIDAFIESIRNLQIEDYKTTNRIGATIKINTDYAPTGEVPKQEITLNDLFAGDNFYAGQIKLEYDQIKEMNADQDFSLEDYQQYALNTHAFEYHSIKDEQYNKEFWVNIAALVVVVGATLLCPPAGIALGAVYGTLEITSAVSGKDWVSSREIDTGERWFRGLLAPLDIIPGVGAAKKFATIGRVNQLHKAVDLGLKTARAGTPLKVTVGKVVDTAKLSGTRRMHQLKEFSAARARDLGRKVEKGLIDSAKVIDSGWTAAKNVFGQKQIVTPDGTVCRETVENTRAVENIFRAKIEDVNGIGKSTKGTGEVTPKKKPVPDWLKERWEAGNNFNKENRPRYPYNEVELAAKEVGGKKYVVDSYAPNKEIVSRKFTQLSEVQEKTAKSYLNEITKKYSSGSKISNGTFNPNALKGGRLKGELILEVPVQNKPIPQAILDEATKTGLLLEISRGRCIINYESLLL